MSRHFYKLLFSVAPDENWKLHVLCACTEPCRATERVIGYNAFIRKARRFGLCSPTCLCDVSEYLRLVDSRLSNRIQRPSHCLSHLLPPEKHHLGLRPRGHSYALPICSNKLCKFSFIHRCLLCFLWLLTVFSITVFAVLFCCNLCVCHLFW